MWFFKRWSINVAREKAFRTGYIQVLKDVGGMSLADAKGAVESILQDTSFFDCAFSVEQPEFAHYADLSPSLRDILRRYNSIECPGGFEISRSMLASVEGRPTALIVGKDDDETYAFIIHGEEPIYFDEDVDETGHLESDHMSVYHWMLIRYRASKLSEK